MAKQLHEERGQSNIPIVETNQLVEMVGSVISSYAPFGDDIAFISSAEPLKSYLFAARAKLSPTTRARRVPFIPLLKLETFRMAAQDRWILAYFGDAVIKMASRFDETGYIPVCRIADLNGSARCLDAPNNGGGLRDMRP